MYFDRISHLVFPSRWIHPFLLVGDKSKRFMMVGTKDSAPVGAKTGVVAPVPINTSSLRQEIHGSQGDNAAIASISRSGASGGWGSATTTAPGSTGTSSDQVAATGKGGRREDGGRQPQGADDVFTRHFPDLRAGLKQAERLDAVTKASSKVAPLRKPKPEPAKDQGPSLRPRGTHARPRTIGCMVHHARRFQKRRRRRIVTRTDVKAISRFFRSQSLPSSARADKSDPLETSSASVSTPYP